MCLNSWSLQKQLRKFIVSNVIDWFYFCLRWEMLQTDEEANLGRGKRNLKAVSYVESNGQKSKDLLSEVHVKATWKYSEAGYEV